MTDRIFGVDLGTTFTTAAWVDDDGTVHALESSPSATPGSKALQSAVYFKGLDEAIVGEEAVREARLHPDPDACLVTGAKRYLGVEALSQTSCDPCPPYQAWGEEWTPVEVSALILKKLALLVERATGTPMRRIVLTHPHFFRESQKAETKVAADLAGLEVVELMTEPSAAALACLADADADQRTLVFDIGGGTLDITLFEVVNGQFRWCGGEGDPTLGGRDFDTALLESLTNEWQQKHGPSYQETTKAETALGFERLLVQAKIALQEPDAGARQLTIRGHDLPPGPTFEFKTVVDAERFDLITRPLVDRARELVLKALKNARGGPWAVTDVKTAILVGGSGRLRAMQAMLRELGLSVVAHQHLDTAVARGAALRARKLTTGSMSTPSTTAPKSKVAALKAMDVGAPPLAYSVGVCLTDSRGQRVIDWLVPQGTELQEATAEREYATTIANATSIAVEIYEGDAKELGPRAPADLAQRLGVVEIPMTIGASKGDGRVVLKLSFSESGLVVIHLREPKSRKGREATLDRAPRLHNASAAETHRSITDMKKRIASTRVL